MNEEVKIKILYSIIIIIFSILLVRIFYIQVIKGLYYRDASIHKSVRIIELPTVRGKILDRNGVVLAEDIPSYELEVTKEDVSNESYELNFISKTTGMSIDKIKEEINSSGIPEFKPIIIKKDLSLKEVTEIKENSFNLPGINVVLGTKRFYPQGEIGENFLGFVGLVTKEEMEQDEFYNFNDVIGKQGIEKEYEKSLRGEKGQEEVQIGPSGRIIKVISTKKPVPGNNIYLTIDIRLQKKLEEIVGNKKGAAIAMDPRNGDILAMVSSPSFDPNKLINGISEEEYKNLLEMNAFFNRATQGAYPSGSTFKPITLISALMNHTITKDTVIYCRNSINIGGITFRDWIYPKAFGYQDPIHALANSSDVFFYTIGTKTGISQIDKYAAIFGLGKKTGVDLPSESSGLLPTPEWKKEVIKEDWYLGDTANLSIGQGYLLITPLQMATLYSGIAENGTEYTPHFLLKITSDSGKIIKTYKNNVRVKADIPQNVINVVKDGMEMLANKPDMRIMKIGGRDVCAKTGTAEVGKEAVDHWLIAFSSRKKTEIVGLLFFDHSNFPSSHALAPLMADLFKEYYGLK
jgi:penicillin-binding protein 2